MTDEIPVFTVGQRVRIKPDRANELHRPYARLAEQQRPATVINIVGTALSPARRQYNIRFDPGRPGIEGKWAPGIPYHFLEPVLEDSTDISEHWWNTQALGTVVHYHYGFNCFVRGEIVIHDDKKQMRWIALIGEWPQHNVWTRNPDGTVNYGQHARGVIDGKITRPNAANMVEFLGFKQRRGEKKFEQLREVSLRVPQASLSEQELATWVQRRGAVLEALECHLSGTDLENDAKAIQEALRAAKTLLEKLPL